MTLRIACLVGSLLVVQSASAAPQSRGTCPQFGAQLCVPLDSSFTVVPFSGSCGRNDDGSASLTLTSWSFDFYGTPWSDVFVNNNGNVSFGAPFSTFTASGFPVSGFPLIAPFWADVDTRANSGMDGVVWYREWSVQSGDSVNRLVVTWDNVGYFSQQVDKLNTFQLILTDGNDPLIGVGNNVCFCYGDMQWTTGSASQGVGGFGGVAATVGANQGNGVDFFQIGRFDQPGNAYDGPGGNNDGVDYLDDQTICFSVGAGGVNVPPIFVNTPTTHMVDVGTQLDFGAQAIGPETGQSVTLAVDTMGLLNVSSIMTTPGNPAVASVGFTPDASQTGTHIVRFTATDNGSPPETAVVDVTIEVVGAGPDVTPPSCSTVQPAPGRVDGEARDDRPNDTGIASVVLGAQTSNLILTVDSFTTGDPVVTWVVGRLDSSMPGQGDITITDVAGNITDCAVALAPAGDCNGNGIPDTVDLANLTSYDWNGNGLPDECEQLGPVLCSPQNHNSTGLPSFLIVTGSNRILDNDVHLAAYNLPPRTAGYFAASITMGFIPASSGISSGNLCLGLPFGGYNGTILRSGPLGVIEMDIDPAAGVPYASQPNGILPVLPGTTVYFQAWFRDPLAVVAGNNASDAVQVLFQ